MPSDDSGGGVAGWVPRGLASVPAQSPQATGDQAQSGTGEEHDPIDRRCVRFRGTQPELRYQVENMVSSRMLRAILHRAQ
eukprot:1353177-Alexandrium_andersonii.AAC.1